jgi:hypothetical protein
MPEREAKGRMLVRELMADREFMTAFSAEEREWYLLTSLFADDAGYLVWDVESNAANLYRYETPRHRVVKVRRIAAKMISADRLVELECGRHAFMPRVARRPRGMKREDGVRREHSECTPSAQGEQSDREAESAQGVHSDSSAVHSPSLPSPSHTNPTRATARDGLRPLREALVANGLDPALLPERRSR